MDTPTDKIVSVVSWRVAGSALALLLALTCLAFYARRHWLAKQHHHDKPLALNVSPCAQLIVDATTDAKGDALGVMSDSAAYTALSTLPDQEKVDLFAATSNLLVACASHDARAVRELSSRILDFMSKKKRQITVEIASQVVGPVQSVLDDHFRNPDTYRSFRNSNSAEELDNGLEVEMELVSFACAVNAEWAAGEIDVVIEGRALRSICRLRNAYAGEFRYDMATVCDKWIAKWRERIDSEAGFYRRKLRETYLLGLESIEKDRKEFSQGVYRSKDDLKAEVWQGARDFGAIFGYTPKWISDYAPSEPKRH